MEILRPLASKNNIPYCHPQSIICCLKPCSRHNETQQNVLVTKVNRRMVTIAATASVFIVCKEKMANASDLVSEQTTDEAEKRMRIDAESLLEVKALLEAESWREAQKVLRKNASNLKKDVYIIIQNKPSSERPLLRKLYSNLFTNVSKLDYAARDKDATRVWESYNIVVTALDDLLSRIQLKMEGTSS